jgi:hypothetical protein
VRVRVPGFNLDSNPADRSHREGCKRNLNFANVYITRLSLSLCVCVCLPETGPITGRNAREYNEIHRTKIAIVRQRHLSWRESRG